MNLPRLLYLSGHAYLENIFFDETKCIASFKVLHHESQEDINLDCEIQGVMEEHLLNLLQEVKKGNSVIVSFTTTYRKFNMALSACGPEDKDHEEQILNLRCKLLELGNCYINGCLIDKTYFQSLKAA